MFRWWLQYFAAARSGGLIEDLIDMLMNFQIFDTKWFKVQSIRIVTPTLASYLASQNWQSFSGNLSSIQKYPLVLHQEKRTTLTFREKPVILTYAILATVSSRVSVLCTRRTLYQRHNKDETFSVIASLVQLWIYNRQHNFLWII